MRNPMKRIFISFCVLSSTLFALSKVSHELYPKKTPINLTIGQKLTLKKFSAANPYNQKTRKTKLFFLVDTQKNPINNPEQFAQAVASVPIMLPKPLEPLTVTVADPSTWVAAFLQRIDGNGRLNFAHSQDLLTQFTNSLNKIMFFVAIQQPLNSRHAHGPIKLLFTADPFPAHHGFGGPTAKRKDDLVKYCFDHGAEGDFESFYNPDGTLIEDIKQHFNDVFEVETLIPTKKD